MSSLWTPGGEHRVEREPVPVPSAPASPPEGAPVPEPRNVGGGPATATAGTEPPELDEERLREALSRAPAEDVVASHCMALAELAALHLEAGGPQHLAAARIAIDACAAIVEGLGDRFGEAAAPLGAVVHQLKMEYVAASGAPGPGRG